MRTNVLLLGLIFAFLSNGTALNAQDDFFTVSGVVRDRNTKKAIEYVNVSAVGTNVGTITNEDGEFALKNNNSLNVKEIQLSCLSPTATSSM